MKNINLLCIGKLGDKHLQTLEQNYLKRFTQCKINIFELKSHKENLQLESKEITEKLKNLSPTTSIFLTERGKQFNSLQFASWLQKKIEYATSISFIIGGASGFTPELIAQQNQVSLSPLTFPHKLARLLLIEQLYRAETITLGHPYNK